MSLEKKFNQNIEDIIKDVQEHVIDTVGYMRIVTPFAFTPRFQLTINSEPLDIFVSNNFIEDMVYFPNGLITIDEMVYSILYEIRRLNPEYLKPNCKHPSDDREFRSS